MDGLALLICELLYGAGLLISECLRLRVQEVDFDYAQLWVRSGKGQKGRVTLLPEKCLPELHVQIEKVHNLHQKDLSNGFGQTILPNALAVKYPSEENRS